jgi:exodeoxyribonuclease-5
MSNYTLSPSQQLAVEKFEDFFLGGEAQHMVIAGAAGTGKSYLINVLIDRAHRLNEVHRVLKNPEKAIHVTATTNKAANLLTMGLTIHSLLGLRVKNDFTTGKTKLILTNSALARQFNDSLIFIDEASMIDRELLRIIKENISGAKIVFIGDDFQLPPVMEKSSPVFRHPNLISLTEIQRQVKGSPIIELAESYKEVLKKGPPFAWPEIKSDNKVIFHLSKDEFKDKLYEEFHENEHSDKRILAYQNKTVVKYNNYIQGFFRADTGFREGDIAIPSNPIVYSGNVTLRSDIPVRLDKFVPTIALGVEGHVVTVRKLGFLNKEIVKAFMPNDWHEANQLKKHFYKHKDFAKYFEIKDRWLDLRYPYASTVHKAQGSTYDVVFVDLADIGANKKWYEIARLVYVAVTRAKHRVYLYGDLPNRWV